MIVRDGRAVPLDEPGLSRLRRFPATFTHDKRKKVKQERRKLARSRRHLRAQARRRHHAGRLGVLLPLLRAHLSRASLDAVPHARLLQAHRPHAAAATCCWCIGMRDGAPLCAALDVYNDDTLWGRYWGTTEYVPGPALRGVLLPGDRVLHRAAASRASKAARRACTSSRAACCPVATHSLHAIGDPASPRPSPISARASASTSRIRATSSRRQPVSSSEPRPTRPTGAMRIYYAATTTCCRCRRATAFRCRSTRRCASAWRPLAADRMREPEPATDAELLRAHDADYVAHVVERHARRARRSGASAFRGRRRWSSARAAPPARRSRRAAARSTHGCGVNLAGGTHHAHREFGEGFCVFNDAAVAARALQAEGRVARVLVVDLDVHQGDGTAAIFAGDASDVHAARCTAARNFPFRKVASDLDVELDDGTARRRVSRRTARRTARRARPLRARISRSTSPAPIRSSATGSDGSR